MTDVVAIPTQPVMMTDTYVEVNGVNLQCLALSVTLEPENKPIEQTTFCGVKDYPGPVKWHFKANFAQSFGDGGTFTALSDALDAYNTAGTLCPFVVRPVSGRPISVTNPSFSGNAIPQPFTVFGGDAGAASEVELDWIMDAPPAVTTTPPTEP
jgi:hypothetical protein